MVRAKMRHTRESGYPVLFSTTQPGFPLPRE